VPGYRAPETTVGPASRVTFVLAGIVADAQASGHLEPPPDLPPVPASLRKEAAGLAAVAMPRVPPHVVVRALMAWTQIFGTLSFERFGHFVGIVEELDEFFDQALRLTAGFLGLGSPAVS
jgi:hypothetical protein